GWADPKTGVPLRRGREDQFHLHGAAAMARASQWGEGRAGSGPESHNSARSGLQDRQGMMS
ncbi:TPA: hypothetical protein ACH3X3_008236, partial [Trebouxia sp. C0006]